MIIKKYNAPTENEAELLAREDLGSDAIVMNVKTIRPKGLFKLFKKNSVELTAAIDDTPEVSKQGKIEGRSFEERLAKEDKGSYKFGEVFADNEGKYQDENREAQNAIEEKINTLARLLDQQKNERSTADMEAIVENKLHARTQPGNMTDYNIQSEREEINLTNQPHSESDSEAESKIITLIKSQLIENEVSEKNADAIIRELELSTSSSAIDTILASVYQKIVLKLGQIEPLKVSDEKPKIVFFVGNTGVGKTTTMAKLASRCTLNDKAKVAMFSVDTYRIAAIDQIKTYANILATPMEVIYTPDDMKKNVEKYSDYDIIMVDTAGRSHTNQNQKNDLMEIVGSVPDYEKEVYLVVSATTKYSDLLNIANTYGELFDLKLIFTKLDETRGIGNILNLKLDTGKPLSYVTWGQNVPDDIGEVNPQMIAKKLLGGAG